MTIYDLTLEHVQGSQLRTSVLSYCDALLTNSEWSKVEIRMKQEPDSGPGVVSGTKEKGRKKRSG